MEAATRDLASGYTISSTGWACLTGTEVAAEAGRAGAGTATDAAEKLAVLRIAPMMAERGVAILIATTVIIVERIGTPSTDASILDGIGMIHDGGSKATIVTIRRARRIFAIGEGRGRLQIQ